MEAQTIDDRIVGVLEDQLSFWSVFDIPKIEHPLLDLLSRSESDKETFFKVSKDPNLMIQYIKMKMIEQWEPESKYKNAFINFARLNVILYDQNPWWRSRVGWNMWMDVTYANPDSYYPLRWEDLYDPRKWYKLGEIRRPEHGGHPKGEGTPATN